MLILASSSVYRSAQLRALGLEFSAIGAAVDESPLPNETPAALAERLAVAKAESRSRMQPEALVIGADQVAEHQGQPIGKPGSHAAALKQLMAMRGDTVLFHSAVALYRQSPSFTWKQVVVTEVVFGDFDQAAAERYLQADQPYDCAGSFKIESRGIMLMKTVRSDDPSALIGLPLIATLEGLRAAGWTLP